MASQTTAHHSSHTHAPSGAQPAADVADRWVQQLRKQARDAATQGGPARGSAGFGGQTGGGGGGGSPRPPSSSVASLRPMSSSPSLLSLDNSGPASPTTTAATAPFPSSSSAHLPPQHRHSAAAAFNSHQNQQSQPSYPPRSHASMPPASSPPIGSVPATSNGHSNGPHGNGRHREQLDRVYGDSRYDAEFDRGISSSSRAGPSSTQASASSSRALFIPDSTTPHNLYSSSTPRTPTSRRSKRDVVEPADVGARRGGKDSRESLESEEYEPSSGRPASRSSRESKTRRKKDDRRRDDESAPGSSSVSLGAGGQGGSRLYDHKKDDPIKFPSSRSSKKAGPNDARSLASSAASFASSDAPERKDKRRDPDPPPFVMELKRAYRDITDAESKLQDEHRQALATAARDDDAAQGVRIQSGVKKLDDEYWVKLATGHKQCVHSLTGSWWQDEELTH